MKKEFKRETKMAIFTYGCIATIYIGILYIFSIFLFPENNVGLITNYIRDYSIDAKTAVLMIFVFIATAIGVYKGTKEIKSDYIRGLAIFLIPTIIVLLFKDSISMAVILMLGYFMVKGIYRVTHEPKKTRIKILKLVLVVALVVTLLLSMGALIGTIANNGFEDIFGMDDSTSQEDSYNNQGFIERPNNMIYYMYLFSNPEKNIALIIAALLFMSFATKEVIKEVIAKYKPTDREIGSLISGTVVLFFAMVVMTSVIQFTYKNNKPQSEANVLREFNFNIKNILLDTSTSNEIKELNLEFQFNKLDNMLNSFQEGSTLTFIYVIDMSTIILEYNLEKDGVEDKEKLQHIDQKYAEKISQLPNRIIENNIKQQNVIYNIMLGLFALFILIEIYEEIRIVQMLNQSKKLNKGEK